MLYASTDVLLSDTNVVQPDILFVRKARAHILTYGVINGAPDLVVEILSPSTAQHDKVRKRELYARFRVPEYWQADAETHSVAVLTLAGDGYEVAERALDLAAAGTEASEVAIRYTTPGYFSAMGARLVTGRGFEPGDGMDVVILDQTAASRGCT